jgi:CarD family transcriptional regulator
MAQKMAPGRARKANKKPATRKAAHHPTPPTKAAKPKVKGAPPKAQAKSQAKSLAKHVRKPAPVMPQKQVATAVKPASTKRPIESQTVQAKQATKSGVPATKHMTATATKRVAPTAPPRLATAPVGARTMPAAVAKTAGQKIIAPPSGQPPAAKVEAPKKPVQKPVHQRHGFKISEWIVYPAHGVGRIVAIEEQEIAGISLELFVITFEKDKMTLRVPTGKSQSVGMRKLAEEPTVRKAMETLRGRARVKRTMWSRRAQEYEAKINSGDLVSIAEVVRDLYRSESQPEQSYSERQLYEAALDRMAREIAVVEKLDERGATQRITEVLAKSARGRRLAAEEAETKAA